MGNYGQLALYSTVPWRPTAIEAPRFGHAHTESWHRGLVSCLSLSVRFARSTLRCQPRKLTEGPKFRQVNFRHLASHKHWPYMDDAWMMQQVCKTSMALGARSVIFDGRTSGTILKHLQTQMGIDLRSGRDGSGHC